MTEMLKSSVGLGALVVGGCPSSSCLPSSHTNDDGEHRPGDDDDDCEENDDEKWNNE